MVRGTKKDVEETSSVENDVVNPEVSQLEDLMTRQAQRLVQLEELLKGPLKDVIKTLRTDHRDLERHLTKMTMRGAPVKVSGTKRRSKKNVEPSTEQVEEKTTEEIA